MKRKIAEINERAIHVTHCKWILESAKDLQKLLYYRDLAIRQPQNKLRALYDLKEIKLSVEKLTRYIGSL